jgi:hypothetical protein
VGYNWPRWLDRRKGKIDDVRLTQDVPLNRPTSFVLPAGGGQINGTVYLVLPQGQILPVHMSTSVKVSQTLPVQM